MSDLVPHSRATRVTRRIAIEPGAHIEAAAIARACQDISAHTTANELLEVAARAALELSGAAACTVSTTHADGSTWLTVHVERQADAIARLTDTEPPRSAAPLHLEIRIEGTPRGVLELIAAEAPAQVAVALAPLIVQIGLGLQHAVLYSELENLVVREMQTSVEREQAMQLVLDSMHDGLLVCELDGRASAIRSRSVTRVFGEPGDQQKIWDYVAGDDAELAMRLELGWEQAVSDVLPFELAVTMMPAELRHHERTYRMAYQRVERDGVLAQLAVSLHDITDEIAARRAHEQAHELAAVVRSVMADRDGFFMFVDETERLMLDLGARSADQARWLHTLKGNTAMFGFRSFAAQCHALEDELADGFELDADRLGRLRASWQQSFEQVRPFLGRRAVDDISVARDELAEQIARMRDAGVAAALLTELDRWRLEPIGPSLDRLAHQAERIACQQGKQLAITIEGARVRLPDDRIRRLLAPLIHAVRNAVDHGIELPAERVAAGKPAAGRLVLACRHSAADIVVEVLDDGRGVSWERVRAKAQALGLPAATRAELIEVLFADGVSTSDAVSELSGRGVGMGALREICRDLGGSIDLASEPGQGTRLTCVVPYVR
jgi:two-component system chemotaxis sensor kinase CheA